MLDADIALFVFSLRNGFFDSVSCFFQGYLNIFVMALLVALFFLRKKDRVLVVPWFLSYFFLGVGFILLKFFIGRMRPHEVLEIVKVSCIDYSIGFWNTSFPSFHSALVFLALPFFVKAYGKKGYLWLVFAVLYSFIRIYTGFHYFSDLVVGALIGYFVAVGFLKIEFFKKWKF